MIHNLDDCIFKLQIIWTDSDHRMENISNDEVNKTDAMHVLAMIFIYLLERNTS